MFSRAKSLIMVYKQRYYKVRSHPEPAYVDASGYEDLLNLLGVSIELLI
jgi:hypothetical protein